MLGQVDRTGDVFHLHDQASWPWGDLQNVDQALTKNWGLMHK